MTRQYVQRVRAQNAEQTRRRILDALAARLRRDPTGTIGLDDIAEGAGVARSTIYLAFGSRAGLFEAFAEDLGQRTGLAALQAANRAPDPRDKLRGAIAAGNRMYAADRPLFRTLFSMQRLDPGALGGIVQRSEQHRADGISWLTGLLAEGGHLRSDTTATEAAHAVFLLTGFESFDTLHTDRGLPVKEVNALIIAIAERAILDDGR